MSTTAERAAPRVGTPREPAKRSDGRENRQRLAETAGELLGRGEPFTLAEVAALAGLSTATAYRHFRSVDDAIDAFVGGFWDDMDARVSAAGPVVDLRRFCGIWVRAVFDWAPALVRLRSREGFLARRSQGDLRVTCLLRLLEPPLIAELTRSGHRPTAEELSYAILLWNAMADPREILDQHASLGWGSRKIAERLHASAVAALAQRPVGT